MYQETEAHPSRGEERRPKRSSGWGEILGSECGLAGRCARCRSFILFLHGPNGVVGSGGDDAGSGG